MKEFSENRKWEFSFSMFFPMLICLVWSFLVRYVKLPIHQTAIPAIFAFSVLYTAVAFAYRSLRFKFSIDFRDLIVFGVLGLVLFCSSYYMLFEAITCDELYHAGKASLWAHIANRHASWWPSLLAKPFPEAIEIFQFAFVLLVGGAVVLWNRWFKFLSNRTVFVVVCGAVFLLGVYFEDLPYRSEAHPPLRLLPLFISQNIFGYDDFSFRIPGLIAMLVVCFCFYKVMLSLTRDYILSFLGALSIGFVPVLFHVSTIVQPSIWASVGWLLFFLCLYRYHQSSDDHFLIFAGIVTGIATMMRQNTLVLWPVLLLVFLIVRPKRRVWILAFAPALMNILSVLSMRSMNHGVAKTMSVFNVFAAVQQPSTWEAIVGTLTLPWVVAGLCGWYLSVRRNRSIALWTGAGLVPGFILYFMVRPELWAMGRYLGEFFGPLIGVGVFYLVVLSKRNHRAILGCALIFLCIYSYGVNRRLPQDIDYDDWSRKRITTESLFPYREALGFLQRQPDPYDFIFLGGVPIYGEYLFLLRGYSIDQVEKYKARQKKLDENLAELTTVDGLRTFLDNVDPRYIVVQYGDRRELLHRDKKMDRAFKSLNLALSEDGFNYIRKFSFVGEREGAVDILERRGFGY